MARIVHDVRSDRCQQQQYRDLRNLLTELLVALENHGRIGNYIYTASAYYFVS